MPSIKASKCRMLLIMNRLGSILSSLCLNRRLTGGWWGGDGVCSMPKVWVPPPTLQIWVKGVERKGGEGRGKERQKLLMGTESQPKHLYAIDF